jgi:hypothetical protein
MISAKFLHVDVWGFLIGILNMLKSGVYSVGTEFSLFNDFS